MMQLTSARRRTLALLAALLVLLVLLAYVALRTGPLAPVAVTLAEVQSRPLQPALFGLGTVEAARLYKIGPTAAGRLRRLDVDVGDRVAAGQVLGEMDAVDLDERVQAQASAVARAQAALRDAQARQAYAQAQEHRYAQLAASQLVSAEAMAAKRQERQVADAALAAARGELARAGAERGASVAQRGNLRLVAPVAGVVVARDADPGTTLVVGQAAVEVVDPARLWVNVRFDQAAAAGLAPGLPARIVLRSRGERPLRGRVLRVEPKADAVTEEILAKVGFEQVPEPLPPLGELAEVTVELPALPAAPVIPNAAIRRDGERVGVWRLAGEGLRFVPVTLGGADLDGRVQVLAGLRPGERVVVHSEKPLADGRRVRVVARIPGVRP